MAGSKHAQPQPRWQPISMLPVIAQLIDDTLASAEEQHATLQEVLCWPHVLDDATVSRTRRVYTETADDIWLYEEQLAHWKRTDLTVAQRGNGDPGARRAGAGHDPTVPMCNMAYSSRWMHSSGARVTWRTFDRGSAGKRWTPCTTRVATSVSVSGTSMTGASSTGRSAW